MRTLRIVSLALLLTLPLFSKAQYPTAIGTTWEYFQYDLDFFVHQAIIQAFQDEVVADTVIDSTTYQKVVRTGRLRHHFSSYPPYDYQELDGTYFYRVDGDVVWVIDSIVQGTAYETVLYDFSLTTGDSLYFLPKNLVELTNYDTYFSAGFTCSTSNPGICSQTFSVDYTAPSPSFIGGWNYALSPTLYYEKNIGTTYSYPYLIVLGNYGQYYYLARLTSQGQELYVHDSVSVGIEPPLLQSSFQIYPNPASDQVIIESENQIDEISFLDLSGRKLLSHVPDFGHTRSVSLALDALEPGLYFVRIKSGNRYGTQKLLLK